MSLQMPQGLDDFSSLYAKPAYQVPPMQPMQQAMPPQMAQQQQMPQQMQQLPQMNVPQSPVDMLQGIPKEEQDHLASVLNQYVQNKQQNSQPNLAQQILANRFQPEMGDTANAITQNAQSFLAPQLFKPTSPDEQMAQRYASQLSPYTEMMKAQTMGMNGLSQMQGGATGMLINKHMQDNPGESWTQAFNAVQSGPALQRMGLMMGPSGISQMQGYAPAMQANKQAEGYGSQQGKNLSDLGMAGPIATQKTTAEEGTKAQFAPRIAAGTAAGQEAGQAAGKSAANLQNIIDQTNTAVGEMENLKNHPSLPYATGMYAMAPVVPGTGIQDFVTREDQLKGQVFLQAYNTLKGGGAISDIEGRKAEQAFARLDRHLSPDDYRQALTDLQGILTMGMNRVKSQASGGIQIPQMDQSQLAAPASGGLPAPPAPEQIQQGGATHRYDPTTGQLVPIQ